MTAWPRMAQDGKNYIPVFTAAGKLMVRGFPRISRSALTRRAARAAGFVSAVVWLSACQTLPTAADVNAQTAPQPTPAPAAPEKAPEPVYSSFDQQTLYDLLVAELAGRRGQFGVATAGYLDLVRHRRGDGGKWPVGWTCQPPERW